MQIFNTPFVDAIANQEEEPVPLSHVVQGPGSTLECKVARISGHLKPF